MKLLSRSLALRIGITLVIIEMVVMGIVGVIYYNRFSEEVDRRLTEQMQIAGELLGNSDLNISSVVNPDVMNVLIGEEIIDSIVIRSEEDDQGVIQQDIIFSLNPEYRGQNIDVFTDIDSTWFDATVTSRIERAEFNNQSVLTGVFPVNTDNTLFLLFRSDVTQADEEKQHLIIIFLVGSLVTILITSLAIFVIFNTSILKRIRGLVTVTGQVEAGKLSVRIAPADSPDEIGILQRSVNMMIVRLEGLFETLEQRVTDRTRDLVVAADVSRRITTVLNEDDLLQQIAERTREGFDLYHVSVFLYDNDAKNVVFRQGTGLVGQKMKERSIQFDLDATSIVAKAAQARTPVLVNNVKESSQYFYNDLLPDTLSEMALPMIMGDQLMGVLDLQANKLDRFTSDDIRALTSLADQIAIAVQNARLYTEAQIAREKAERSDQVKSAFLASMSHELRTPLNAIINFSEFVQEGDLGPVNSEQEDVLGRVVGNGKHLLKLINDVLDMSKIEAGALNLFVEDNVDLKDVLATVLQTSRGLLADKPVELQSEFDNNLPLIRGDRQRIVQILLNITSNACKFTQQGWIKVSAHSTNEEVIVSVQDTGPGIAVEDQPLVFQAFKQTSIGLRQGGGTGLGMALSKNLVETHGGKIWFESEPGKGTTFFVSLPIKSEALVPVILKGGK